MNNSLSGAMPGEVPQLVSIVIVNYNGARVLEPCLRSVFAQPYRPIEVIVVDNASSDDSVEMVRRDFPDVHLLLNNVNLGFAEGNNRGVAIASSDRIVLLNNDTTVQVGWLTSLLDVACQPGVGAVTSRVITDGVPSTSYEMNGTINYLGYNIMRVFSDLSTVFFAGGASMTFSRHEVGFPFLPEYFLYHEDVYLSWRLRLRGLDVCMAQESVVRHLGSATTRRQPSALVTFYQERNRLLNPLLFYERRTLMLLLPFFVIDGLVKGVVALLGRGKSLEGLFRAYAWILAHKPWIAGKRGEIQRDRKVEDRVIMKWMSSKVMQGDGVLATIPNALSSAYARLVGLASYD